MYVFHHLRPTTERERRNFFREIKNETVLKFFIMLKFLIFHKFCSFWSSCVPTFLYGFSSFRVYFTTFVHNSPHLPLYKYQGEVGLYAYIIFINCTNVETQEKSCRTSIYSTESRHIYSNSTCL